VKQFIVIFLCTGFLVCVGCGSNSGSRVDPCLSPTAGDCLNPDFYQGCQASGGDSFVARCDDVVEENHQNELLEQKSSACVPELTGDHERQRAIKDVIHHDQTPLYVFGSAEPDRFTLSGSRNTLLAINDSLLNEGSHSSLFQALDVNFKMAPDITSTLPGSGSKALPLSNVVQPLLAETPGFRFDGISYTQPDHLDLLDALYVGKVTEWDDNGLGVASCEEYVFEKYYDLTLFRDFATLHEDDPMRVTEFAFRGSTWDENGLDLVGEQSLSFGAIGTKVLSFVYSINPRLFQKKGAALIPDPDMVFAEPTGTEDYMTGALFDLGIHYYSSVPRPGMIYSDYLDNNPLADHEFYKNVGKEGYYIFDPISHAYECVGNCEQKDFIPKNFFLEVMGRIKPANTDRVKGIVLSEDALLGVYGQPDFYDAAQADIWGYDQSWDYLNQFSQWGYDNTFRHHLMMYTAARKQYPSIVNRNSELLKFKLLRKHLIELLAERAYFEEKIPTENLADLLTHPTADILTEAESLSPSEKKLARLRIDDLKAGGHLDYVVNNNTKKNKGWVYTYPEPELIGIRTASQICASLDVQIEAVLLKAKEYGALETDRDPSKHNYPVVYTVTDPYHGDYTETFDMDYDKVLCDWSPENFTESALTVLPDRVLDKTYAECQRLTAGDFEITRPDEFIFYFPATGGCDENSFFNVWHPNTYIDYTQDSNQFDKLRDLVEYYPRALEDCQSIVNEQVKRDLKENGLNYFDPVSGQVLMSRSSSYYDQLGGKYASLEFGYAMGWLYEGYENIPGIMTMDETDRSFVCENTHYFAFGNYFVEGSFLNYDFVLCSAGSYASNKTAAGDRPTPPTLDDDALVNKINGEISAVAAEHGVTLNSFMFIKNEKMTYTYSDSSGLTGTPVTVSHSQAYNTSTHDLDYTNEAVTDTQMLSITMKKSVPVCGFISVTIKGSVTGDIDADTFVDGDNSANYMSDQCKKMNFNYTPRMDFDAYAQASVTAGIPGVASVSAGIDIGLKFVGIRYPYEFQGYLSQNSTENPANLAADKKFNYDIHTQVLSNLDQEITLLSGFFGAFVEVEYVVDSTTYRQTLFSWDGIRFDDNLDRVGLINSDGRFPVKIPVRALYSLAEKYKQ